MPPNTGGTTTTSSIDGFDVALTDATILLLSLAGFLALGLSVYVLVLRRLKLYGNDDDDGEGVDQNGNRRILVDRGEGGDAYVEALASLSDADAANLSRAERRARDKILRKRSRRGVGATGVAAAAANEGEEEGVATLDVGGDGENDDLNSGRKQERRTRTSKALVKEERRKHAEESRRRREAEEREARTKPKKRHSGGNYDGRISSSMKSSDNEGGEKGEQPSSAEELFPKRRDPNNPLSEYFLREAIVQKWNLNAEECPHSPRTMMTVEKFIHRLRIRGCVSVAALADEYDIPASEVVRELERIGKNDDVFVRGGGTLGVLDHNTGMFHYASEELIEGAVRRLGEEGGKIESHRRVSQ